MKHLIWPIMLITATSGSISAQPISMSLAPALSSDVSSQVVVKRFSTKGRQITTPVTIVASSAASLPDLLPLNALSTPQTATVSPVGRWLNHGFSWINSGLGVKDVKPWQKATLAEPAMTGGVAPTLTKFATKIFISKEATLGGNGVAGGGCGCK